MGDEIICPLCGELAGKLLCDIGEYVCKKCRTSGNDKMWQALIQSQRDLQIAKQALEEIKNDLWCNRNITARQALEQITHDNKE